MDASKTAYVLSGDFVCFIRLISIAAIEISNSDFSFFSGGGDSVISTEVCFV